MRTLLIAGVAGALTLAGVGTASAADNVTVMTRNVFLGADLGPALRAGGTTEFIDAAGQIFRQLESTNFPQRARLPASTRHFRCCAPCAVGRCASLPSSPTAPKSATS
ncbi:MAG: hypothetical protein V9E82_00920 [Candidatus Nanopelagicales bacterium]